MNLTNYKKDPNNRVGSSNNYYYGILSTSDNYLSGRYNNLIGDFANMYFVKAVADRVWDKLITRGGFHYTYFYEKIRSYKKMRMKFYNVPEKPNRVKQDEIFNVAMSRKCVMMALCEFLIVIWSGT